MEKGIIMDVTDLNLWYGEKHALHGVSMKISEHRITALIGPSGCGKSTFLRSLNRMNDLVEGCKITGKVVYQDKNIYDPDVDVTGLRKRIGMVSRRPIRSRCLFMTTSLTVREFMA